MMSDKSKELENLENQEGSKDEIQISQSHEQPLERKDLDKLPKSFKHASSHLIDQILGDPTQGIMARVSLQQYCNNVAFISKLSQVM